MSKPYNGPVDEKCPYYGKLCARVCPTCRMFVQIRGANPQTGEPIDLWDCVFPVLAMLTIENSQQQRQTGAAVESFRNEMVKANNEMSLPKLLGAQVLTAIEDRRA